jgi:hypothetical protein
MGIYRNDKHLNKWKQLEQVPPEMGKQEVLLLLPFLETPLHKIQYCSINMSNNN